MNFAHCLHTVFVIGKYTDVFRGISSGGGWGDWVTWEILSMEEFFMKKIISMKGALDIPALFKK